MRKPRAKPTSSVSKPAIIRAQMEKLQNELKRAEIDEEASFGKLARKAGIFDLDIPEAAMLEALNGIVESFRNGAPKNKRSPETPKPDAEGTPDGSEGPTSPE